MAFIVSMALVYQTRTVVRPVSVECPDAARYRDEHLLMKPTIRLGVSSCLLGERVRYDGNHKRDEYVVRALGAHFDLVPVCPEMAIGLGVPRAPIHLVGDPGAPRAVGVDDATRDVTDRLAAYGHRMARALDDISGYVFKSRSPSCGLEQVAVHAGDRAIGTASGIYARAFMDARPLLPVTDEAQLQDPEERARFIERVHAYHRQRCGESG